MHKRNTQKEYTKAIQNEYPKRNAKRIQKEYTKGLHNKEY